MTYFSKYGIQWKTGTDPLDIEFACIQKGGRWNHPKTGEPCGAGLFEHFMTARKLIWPHRYRHRWTDLLYEHFVANDLTVLMGCASSQKTSHGVEFCLLNYWARPENTLIILSTVNLEKLEIGVWGECKRLWAEGRKRYDWLAGNIIDHKKALSTDSLEEDEVRDMRKGVISRPCYTGGRWVGLGVLAGLKQDYIIYYADECFPAGTLVDTPNGTKAIESLQPGDMVISAIGPNQVKAIGSQEANKLVRVKAKDGREFTCTPNHPVFTQFGWVHACNLCEKHYMLSPDETLRIVQQGVYPQVERSPFLQLLLLLEMGSQPTKNKSFLLKSLDGSASEESCLAATPSATHAGKESHAQPRKLPESSNQDSGDGLQADSTGWQWYWPIESGVATDANVSRRDLELPDQNRHECWERLPNMLQSRFGFSSNQTSHRSRWRIAQQPGQTSERPKERCVSGGGAWVESVEVLQQGDPRFPHSDSDISGCRVYNLQVEGHPSYSVNGLIVHNCQFMDPAFASTWPHLFSNGNVKVIASGNPKHDPEDQMGRIAEPRCGWNSMPEPDKTTVWDTKFLNGKCINLVGTDSPNFDVPEGDPEPFPRLIGRKFAERIAHDHGPGSFEYYRLVKGVMRVAFSHSRVITRQLCREHHALEQVKWQDQTQTNIYAVDPSYGGEDRCVGMPGKIGIDIDGNQILELLPYRVFKLDLRKETAVEDQIAEILEEELETYDVPPENCFYDATGKGTIGAALARRFGHRVPVAIDSGARPTKRPVREDLFVDDELQGRRLKRCDEHYSKFVSEMWFSLRYAIEADQIRGLLEDVMDEGCARIYEMAAGNKIEVEPKYDPKKKEDLKRRLGKSPDLFDAAVMLTEGARQRGFKIQRLGVTKNDSDKGLTWLTDRVKKHDALVQSKQLEYA